MTSDQFDALMKLCGVLADRLLIAAIVFLLYKIWMAIERESAYWADQDEIDSIGNNKS